MLNVICLQLIYPKPVVQVGKLQWSMPEAEGNNHIHIHITSLTRLLLEYNQGTATDSDIYISSSF
jgi:hypothetical protein